MNIHMPLVCQKSCECGVKGRSVRSRVQPEDLCVATQTQWQPTVS